jgi:hypothetical protein
LDDNVNEFAKVVLESHRVPDIIGMSNQCWQSFLLLLEFAVRFFLPSDLVYSSSPLNAYVQSNTQEGGCLPFRNALLWGCCPKCSPA